jgi:hypothetical protein
LERSLLEDTAETPDWGRCELREEAVGGEIGERWFRSGIGVPLLLSPTGLPVMLVLCGVLRQASLSWMPRRTREWLISVDERLEAPDNAQTAERPLGGDGCITWEL